MIESLKNKLTEEEANEILNLIAACLYNYYSHKKAYDLLKQAGIIRKSAKEELIEFHSKAIKENGVLPKLCEALIEQFNLAMKAIAEAENKSKE